MRALHRLTSHFGSVIIATLTLLCGSRSSGKRSMIRAIEELNPLFWDIPSYPSRQGLRVWENH